MLQAGLDRIDAHQLGASGAIRMTGSPPITTTGSPSTAPTEQLAAIRRQLLSYAYDDSGMAVACAGHDLMDTS